ncbi:T9SS type A sorting domain-containing protein [Plebeiibacterium sediminum]|uniref:T9SS type A sorting domain-containing protein n=1 Tax=Plebeiibacterium sediminum TaxID=2992112 RepID=A0AAE3M6M6_9BACT|nr:T9SS type A sorting domain-containing protein [Plebeiobacterium sediminum]MCW3787956.1 T9SS type A sorting domain-containing protein [Plebeiobacterium sediminum]
MKKLNTINLRVIIITVFALVCYATKINSQVIDITDQVGNVYTETGNDSPDNEGLEKLFDNDNSTKYLTFNQPVEVTIVATKKYVVSSYEIVSGNDEPDRDPYNWTLYGSNDGTNWEVIEVRTGEIWTDRIQSRSFDITTIPNGYSMFKFAMEVQKVDGTILQFQELNLYGTEDTSTSIDNFTTSDLSMYVSDSGNSLILTNLSEGESKITVFNIDGSLMLEQVISNSANVKLDIAGLSSGIYLIRVANGQVIQTQKIIK